VISGLKIAGGLGSKKCALVHYTWLKVYFGALLLAEMSALPHAVEISIKRLGADLKLARLRRNLTIDQVAAKIGANKRTVMGAENGKPTTGAWVFFSLLWVYDLVGQMDEVALPSRDEEGLMLARLNERLRSRHHSDMLDDDF